MTHFPFGAAAINALERMRVSCHALLDDVVFES
jgi:hypothetical protein